MRILDFVHGFQHGLIIRGATAIIIMCLCLQALLAVKNRGLDKLNSAIEEGEKLYPDTAPPGRDKIRQQLRTAKDVWDSLMSDLGEISRRLDAQRDQWSAYQDSSDQVERWLLEVETWLDADAGLKDGLSEKKTKLQNCKVWFGFGCDLSTCVICWSENAKCFMRQQCTTPG